MKLPSLKHDPANLIIVAILNAVSERTRLPVATLLGRRGPQAVTDARQLFVFLVFAVTDLRSSELARRLSVSRSNVDWSIASVRDRLSLSASLRSETKTLITNFRDHLADLRAPSVPNVPNVPSVP